jgi:Ni,Fe-hydrogenase III component G
MSAEAAGTDADKSGKAHFWAYRLNEYATNMAVEIDQRCPKEKSCLVRNDSSVRPRLPASSRGGREAPAALGRQHVNRGNYRSRIGSRIKPRSG